MPEVKKETPSADPPDATRAAPDSFTLAHISDLHLTSLVGTSVSQLLNKRLLGYLSWWRKRRHVHRPEVVEALLEDLSATCPDHIAVTGDLTHLGLPAEFAEAARWLTRLGPPDRVTVIPGNHEAYAGRTWSDHLSTWRAYLQPDGGRDDRRVNDFFPSLRIRGPVALLGLCSARPSLPFLAVGSLNRGQLDTLAGLLQTSGAAGLVRVVLIHHPPVPGSIKWRKRLEDGRALIDVIAGCGAELVLHGHTHAPTFTEIHTPVGDVPVVGAPSASELNPQAGRCAAYNLFKITQNGGCPEMKMMVRSYAEESGRFVASREINLPLPCSQAGTQPLTREP